MDNLDVFGVSPYVLDAIYVDRGHLDKRIARHLKRPAHLLILGDSKSGKTWLRQMMIPDAVVIACRADKTAVSMFSEAIRILEANQAILHGSQNSQLEERYANARQQGVVQTKYATGRDIASVAQPVADIDTLLTLAQLLHESSARLVIEDYHTLPQQELSLLAAELKALWDLGISVVLIGVADDATQLVNHNPNLSSRVEFVTVGWEDHELFEVLDKGMSLLNIKLDAAIEDRIVDDCHGNVGLLQRLAGDYLDALGIFGREAQKRVVSDQDTYHKVAQQIAGQMAPLYKEYARGVMEHMRRLPSSGTHMALLRALFNAPSRDLLHGISLESLSEGVVQHDIRMGTAAHDFSNALHDLNAFQGGAAKGRVFHFDEVSNLVNIVDKQMLFFRKYSGLRWPWETTTPVPRSAQSA